MYKKQDLFAGWLSGLIKVSLASSTTYNNIFRVTCFWQVFYFSPSYLQRLYFGDCTEALPLSTADFDLQIKLWNVDSICEPLELKTSLITFSTKLPNTFRLLYLTRFECCLKTRLLKWMLLWRMLQWRTVLWLLQSGKLLHKEVKPEWAWRSRKHSRISTPPVSAGWWPAALQSPQKCNAPPLTKTDRKKREREGEVKPWQEVHSKRLQAPLRWKIFRRSRSCSPLLSLCSETLNISCHSEAYSLIFSS